MEDISLHILDITENSTNAGATEITVTVIEDPAADTLTVSIEDNGRGMSRDFLERADDPFKTTRTTRRVGLGLSLLKQAALMTGGDFSINSTEGKGTSVRAVFRPSHIDCKPLGDIASTVTTLISGHPDIHFSFHVQTKDIDAELDTAQLQAQLDGVPLTHPEVLRSIRDLFTPLT